ncbi:MAG: YIP1 family protein [Acidobacteria bacterium]|nr:YIP1 family protein [Acidobacteriota bacterium]
MFTVAKKVGFDQIVQQKMEQRAEKTGQQLSPEQRAQGMKIGVAITKGIFMVAPLFSLVFAVVISFLLWLGMNFVLGGTAHYTRLFTLAIYAGLPRLLMLVVAIVSIWFGNNDSFYIENPAGTNIGYYLSADAPKWMTTLGTSLDVTMIWMVALLALGGAILAKVKVRNSMILVFATWLVLIVVKALLA